jgi:O-antigen/teichoic acid export membrane protein
VISTLAAPIVILLGGPQFLAATGVVQLLAWALAVAFLGQVAARTCMAASIEHQIPYVTGAAATINVVLNLALIPRWQFLGAGIAALASETVALFLFLLLLRQYLRLWPIAWTLLRVLLSNMPAVAFMAWRTSPWLAAPLSFLLTLAGYFMTRVLTWRDITLVRQFLSSRRGEQIWQIETARQVAVRALLTDVADRPTQIMPVVRAEDMHANRD